MGEYSNADFCRRMDRHREFVVNRWDAADNRRLSILESKRYMLAGLEKRKKMRSVALSRDLRRWVY